MRLSQFPLLVFLTVPVRAAAQDSPPCTKHALAAETPFDTTRVRYLPGRFELVLVLTKGAEWGAADHYGHLELWVQDSARSHRGIFGRARPGWERPVAGSFVIASPDSNRPWWKRMASADLDHPGVMLQGHSLRMGDLDAIDGTGEVLTITHIAPGGFRGSWKQDNGIAMMIDTITHKRVPDPGGYFCARRLSDIR